MVGFTKDRSRVTPSAQLLCSPTPPHRWHNHCPTPSSPLRRTAHPSGRRASPPPLAAALLLLRCCSPRNLSPLSKSEGGQGSRDLSLAEDFPLHQPLHGGNSSVHTRERCSLTSGIIAHLTTISVPLSTNPEGSATRADQVTGEAATGSHTSTWSRIRCRSRAAAAAGDFPPVDVVELREEAPARDAVRGGPEWE
jgi:hypothetical protein